MKNHEEQVISRSGYSGIKLQPGTSLPIRNLPRSYSSDEEIEPPKFYQEWALSRLLRNLQPLFDWVTDSSKIVEEYAGESSVSLTGETQLTVIADYSPASELIEEVLVTGPANCQFVLQLGDRLMTMATDNFGKCLLSPVRFKLKPDSQRILTAGIQPGNQNTLTASNPAAGQPFIFANSTPGPITLDSLIGTLTTDAVVANRFFQIIFHDAAGNVIWRDQNNIATVASTNVTVSAFLGATQGNSASGNAFLPLPSSIQIPPGGNVEILVANMDVGDTLTAISGSYSGGVPNGSWMLHLSGHVINSRRYT